MPSTFAHYQFGEACRAVLPDPLRRIIGRQHSLYERGVHGPDILFYFHPLKSNAVRRLGSEMHREPAATFFREGREVYRRHPGKEEANLSYLFAFLTHFALDSSCHSIVERVAAGGVFSHNLIETAFDAYLLRRAGFSRPTAFDRSILLPLRAEDVPVISRFFDLDEGTIRTALEGQMSSLRHFYSPRGIKKALYQAILRTFFSKDETADLFIEKSFDTRLDPLMLCLDGLWEMALNRFAQLAPNLWHYLRDEAELDPYFAHAFNAWEDEEAVGLYEELLGRERSVAFP